MIVINSIHLYVFNHLHGKNPATQTNTVSQFRSITQVHFQHNII